MMIVVLNQSHNNHSYNLNLKTATMFLGSNVFPLALRPNGDCSSAG